MKNQTLMYDFINDRAIQEAIRGKSNQVFQEHGMRDRYDTQCRPTLLAQSLQPAPAQATLARSGEEEKSNLVEMSGYKWLKLTRWFPQESSRPIARISSFMSSHVARFAEGFRNK